MRKDNFDTAEEVIFDDNLSFFGNKIAIIIALEQGGKMKPEEAYSEIKKLFKALKKSKKSLLDRKEKNE